MHQQLDLDFEHFHRTELPARLASGHAKLALADIAGEAPIAFRLPDGRAYTYVPNPAAGTIDIEAGDITAGDIEAGIDRGATVVELSERDWRDHVTERLTCYSLMYGGALRFRAGGFDGFMRWEPALRAMFQGRPVYDPARLASALPRLDQSFTMDELDAVRDFMSATGFAHVRGVFNADEVDRLRREYDAVRSLASQGDKRSWWAKNARGEDVCCRLTYVNERSRVVATLGDDPRFARLIAAVQPEGTELVHANDRFDGDSIVIKHHDVVEGLSNLPWHVDCGLGGHPLMCPTIQIGVQLDAATPETGQLHFLAGSNGASCHQYTSAQLEAAGFPTVAITTEPGDVTLHFSDTLHLAPPPHHVGTTGGRSATPSIGRRAMYLSWTSRAALDVVPPGHGYNDVLLSRDDGIVASVPEAVGHVASERAV